jgi:phosphoribosylformylglycinamidine synthase subunit PurL
MKELRNYFEKKGTTLYLVKDEEAINFLNGSIENDFISCLHIISNEGLYKALVDCCKKNQLGFDITGDSEIDDKTFLYGKTPYKAIVGVKEDQEDDFVDYMFENKIDIMILGHVTKGELRMDDKSFGFIKDIK